MSARTDRKAQYEKIHAEAEAAGVLVPAMRELCRTDLFYLLTRGLGRADIDHDWLFDRCLDVQLSPDNHLDLWAREHCKSTLITFGKTIQDILADPEVTVGIFSHTKPIARAFLRQIKYEFETNERLKYLFPDVLWANPKKEAPNWSEDAGITVKRRGNAKESTVEAHGLVDGQPTSKHFSLLVYDDVVTRESVTTPEMIKKTTEAWELSLNLGAHGGRVRYIGTRYHANDTWATIMSRGIVTRRVYTATADGTPEGRPVFISPAANERKRREMGSYTYACQMLQNPLADEAQGFRAEWLRSWPADHAEGLNVYILVDPANEKKKTSDYTSMFVVGLGRDQNYYVLDMIRDRLNLTERAKHLLMLHQRWRPIGVGYEHYGIQADIQHIEFVQGLQNYRFPITPLGGSMPKNDRIRRLIPLFESGRVFLPHGLVRAGYDGRSVDLVRAFIDEEYTLFPVAPHDDMLDCLARIEDPALGAIFPLVDVVPVQKTQSESDWYAVTAADNSLAVVLED